MPRLRYFSITLLFLIIDRLTKWWVSTSLGFNTSRDVVGTLVQLHPTENTGAAFGMFQAGGTVFLIVSSIVSLVLFLILLTMHIDSRLIRTGMAFVLAGALGNLIDRVQWGYVLDFIQLRGLFIFNVADACITVGAILIIIATLFGGERDRSARETDSV